MNPEQQLIAASSSLALLIFIVGLRMLAMRIQEMQRRAIHPQAVALSQRRDEKLQDSRASDNYNNLFQLPMLFFALCAVAIAMGNIPAWLPALAWIFVLLRIAHSAIQCSYNKVMHRFPVFLAGFFLLAGMWVGFGLSQLLA